MQLKYSDLVLAFDFVSDSSYENTAAIDRESGQIYYMSEFEDVDECPDDIDDEEKYLHVPNKYDLDLGNTLAFEFAKSNPGLDYDEVREIFRKKGAYRRFGDLLDRTGLRDKWHRFEDEQTRKALTEWGEENNIMIID